MDLIQLSRHQATITITINKPQALNALSSEVLSELNRALDEVANYPETRCLVITGAGDRAFVAGADIKEIHSLDSETANSFAGVGQKTFMRLEALDIPVIAKVNGFALGGGLELAMACDFIIASQKAKFGLPECTLGLMPGFGGSVRLARLVGPARAKQMTFSGDMISADEALQFGLVNQVVAPEELNDHVRSLATTISLRAPKALAAIKRTIQKTYGMEITEAMAMEQKEFGELFTTKDCKEGTLAFIEKRKPEFTGK